MRIVSRFRKRLNRTILHLERHREVVTALFILVVLVIISSLGYVYFEGWSFFDGFYMTFITLTTIGYGETHTLSYAGRVWTMFIALFGIGTVVFILGRAAEVVISGSKFFQKNMQHTISNLRGHTIICGLGRIGERIVRQLAAENRPFVVLERSAERCETLKEKGFLFLIGDAEDEHILKQAGIEHAKNIVLTLPEDRDNAFTALLARSLNPNIFILARTNYEQNFPLLKRAGANQVMSPYEIGAARMAQRLLRPHVFQFMEQMETVESLDLIIEELEIKPQSVLANQSLRESNLRGHFEVIIIGIHDPESGKTLINPKPETILLPHQILIAMGDPEKMQAIEKVCRGN